jgi:hypothetical protein
MKIAKAVSVVAAALALLPGTALAHHGHHHRGVMLKGTVASVDASNGTLVVTVADANRRGAALEGHNVTVQAVKGWVADTNNDGKHSIADVQSGDTVLVFTKRRFVNSDANTVSAAFVVDKTHPAKFATRSDGDHHNCDRT